MDDEQLVTVARFRSDAEFMLARTRLESAGIECAGRNEYASRLVGHVFGVFGAHEIELQVHAADAEDARAVLETESPLAEAEDESAGDL